MWGHKFACSRDLLIFYDVLWFGCKPDHGRRWCKGKGDQNYSRPVQCVLTSIVFQSSCVRCSCVASFFLVSPVLPCGSVRRIHPRLAASSSLAPNWRDSMSLGQGRVISYAPGILNVLVLVWNLFHVSFSYVGLVFWLCLVFMVLHDHYFFDRTCICFCFLFSLNRAQCFRISSSASCWTACLAVLPTMPRWGMTWALTAPMGHTRMVSCPSQAGP